MGSGLLTVFVWSYGLGYSNDVFEVLPGMLVGVLVYLVSRLWVGRRGQGIEESLSGGSRTQGG
jgi:sodium/proline symporter